MKNNIKKFFDFYKRKSIAVKTFKRLHENFKSLSVFYRILFVLGIIMPFVLFIEQWSGLGFFTSDDVIGMQKYGILYILKYEKYSFYKIFHSSLALFINLIALLRDEYNLIVIFINVIMFCCASYRIVLIVFGIIISLLGGF